MTSEKEKTRASVDPEEEKEGEGFLSELCMFFPSKKVRREFKRHLLNSEAEMIKAFRSLLDAGIDCLEKKEKKLQKQPNTVEKIDIE